MMLFATACCLAQNQANRWYFGNGAGIDFNSGQPVALTNGQTYLQNGHAEGTAVICDGNGSLLFYTNGETIWNKAHGVMGNGSGLMGSYSAAQSSLILPLPGSQRLFYVFTLDDFNNNLQDGFRYSVVDMCLENQYGLVVSGQKNILIANTMGEQLTAVRHANGKDYWVIVHKFFSKDFYAYLFSSAGLSATPVITSIGSMHTSTAPLPASALGIMKASPNGRRIGIVTANGGKIREVFDFDNSTGVLSNFINLHTPADINQDAYNCSFSPDNTKFYLTFNIKVWQYDLTAGGGTASAIQNSKTLINGTSTGNNYALQLAPDGKIYIGEYGAPYLSVINSPNSAGLACGYVQNAINLLGKNCNFGLPNFVDSFSYSNKDISCLTDVHSDSEPSPDVSVVYICSSQTLQVSSASVIDKVEIYTLGGVLVDRQHPALPDVTLYLNCMADGIYVVRITTQDKLSVQIVSVSK